MHLGLDAAEYYRSIEWCGDGYGGRGGIACNKVVLGYKRGILLAETAVIGVLRFFRGNLRYLRYLR